MAYCLKYDRHADMQLLLAVADSAAARYSWRGLKQQRIRWVKDERGFVPAPRWWGAPLTSSAASSFGVPFSQKLAHCSVHQFNSQNTALHKQLRRARSRGWAHTTYEGPSPKKLSPPAPSYQCIKFLRTKSYICLTCIFCCVQPVDITV